MPEIDVIMIQKKIYIKLSDSAMQSKSANKNQSIKVSGLG